MRAGLPAHRLLAAAPLCWPGAGRRAHRVAQASRWMAGSKWRRQRPMHCWLGCWGGKGWAHRVAHASRRMAGSRWRRQRPMHCWSVRPSRRRAMSAHALPCSATSATSASSSSSVHFSFLMFGFTCAQQRPPQPAHRERPPPTRQMRPAAAAARAPRFCALVTS